MKWYRIFGYLAFATFSGTSTPLFCTDPDVTYSKALQDLEIRWRAARKLKRQAAKKLERESEKINSPEKAVRAGLDVFSKRQDRYADPNVSSPKGFHENLKNRSEQGWSSAPEIPTWQDERIKVVLQILNQRKPRTQESVLARLQRFFSMLFLWK